MWVKLTWVKGSSWYWQVGSHQHVVSCILIILLLTGLFFVTVLHTSYPSNVIKIVTSYYKIVCVVILFAWESGLKPHRQGASILQFLRHWSINQVARSIYAGYPESCSIRYTKLAVYTESTLYWWQYNFSIYCGILNLYCTSVWGVRGRGSFYRAHDYSTRERLFPATKFSKSCALVIEQLINGQLLKIIF